MIKTSRELQSLLELITPLAGASKVKVSSFRHPCFDKHDHNVVKEEVATLKLGRNTVRSSK